MARGPKREAPSRRGAVCWREGIGILCREGTLVELRSSGGGGRGGGVGVGLGGEAGLVGCWWCGVGAGAARVESSNINWV